MKILFKPLKRKILTLTIVALLPAASFAAGQADQNNVSKIQKFEGY